MKYIIEKKICRLCESKKLTKVFDLCKSPLANNLATNSKSSLKADFLPLNLMFCDKCFHLQLQHVVNPKKLYSKYLYMPGISKSFKLHFENFSKEILKKYKNFSNKNILEIGSNDCVLLNFFKNKGFNTVGVEPAKNLYYKTKNYHTIYNSFFNANIGHKLKKKYGSFDLIVANNVFSHIDDLKTVFILLKKLMHNESVIIFEVSYLGDILKKKLFDTIYHEHLDYHAITPLNSFFKKINLKILDIKKIPSHGGSVRVFVGKKNTINKVNYKHIAKIKESEKKIGIHNKNTYKKFFTHLILQRKKLKKFFDNIQGQTVYGYGAPAKAVTLMNFFNLNHKNINLIIDDSKLKQKKFIPGSKIKIHNSKILKTKPPKYIIILAWNLYKDILFKLNDYKKIKNMIIPLPKFKIIKK